jgi:hypothetical protein
MTRTFTQPGDLAMARHLILLGGLLGCGSLFAACTDNAVVPDDPNRRPVADARIRVDGNAVDEKTDAEALKIPLAAGVDSVEVTLDATKSTDADGRVASYRWLSATSVPDGGVGALSYMGATGVVAAGGRFVPGAEPGAMAGAREGVADWPEDVERPVVELGEGAWSFSLWVTDNDGATSSPDTVTVLVGEGASGGGPEVEACIAEVIPTVPDACSRCLCGVESCRGAVVQSACDENCWGLIQCIGAMCPDFAAMAAMMDVSCVTGNCSAFLAGGTAAMPVGMCIRNSCAEACTSM